MALSDVDWGGVFTEALKIGAGYAGQQMQLKQAKKLAKASASRGMPWGGFGFSAGGGPPVGGALPGWTGTPIPQGTGTLPGVTGSILGGLGALGVTEGSLGAVGEYMGIGTGEGPGCTQKFRYPPAGPRAVPISLISDVNPSTGRLTYWRHVGQPILFSGDVSHCRRVNKLLGKAARKAGRKGGR